MLNDMGEKINVAELLKDCPKGMELDCALYENLYFDYVREHAIYPIVCYTVDNKGEKISISFNWYGKHTPVDTAKCVIFPKGKTTWKGFVPPCEFKAGDVLVSRNGNIVLLSHIDSENIVHYHCIIPNCGNFRIEENTSIGVGKYYQCDLANEQQRQRMYDRIKCSGYKYNQHINKLEKLVEPKFKVGDRIRYKRGNRVKRRIVKINNREEFYYTDDGGRVYFMYQDDWELVPNKFDITTLKPFESRVLVRNSYSGFWMPTFWGVYETEKSNEHQYRNYLTTKGFFRHCIPYNDDTKHLVGKTDDCDEYYKTWA